MTFNKLDYIITIITFLSAALLLKLFFDDVNRVTSREGLEYTATITFKKNKAQRQFNNSLRWERLQNESPVYDGDTVRTGTNSEAALHFDDGTGLDLADSTIIQIRTLLDSHKIDFMGGSLSLRSGQKRSGGVTVNTKDGSVISFEKGAVASMLQSGDVISVGVDSGTASVVKNGVTQSVDRSNELSINVKSGTLTLVKRSIYPVEPQPDSRFVVFDKDAESVRFKCDSSGLPGGSAGVVELASSPGFESVQVEIPAVFSGSEISASVDVPAGEWYWRVKLRGKTGSSDDISSSARRLIVYRESSLKGISPDNNQEINYRRRLPDVTFNWSELKYAGAYILEVSATPDFAKTILKMRTGYHQITSSAIGDGEWYWRVTPIYPFLNSKPDMKIGVNKFKIRKSDAIEKPEAYIPVENSLYEIASSAKKGIGFSWSPRAEAISYEIVVSESQDMSNPVLQAVTPQSWYRFKDAALKPILKQKSWYWAVRTVDEEGGKSAWSDPRKITGVDAIVSQRLIYPPDEYIIADSLITNIRFTWRSNIPAKKIFQVSKTLDFKEIFYQSDVESETMLGKSWPVGKWFWRIRTLNSDGSVFLDSNVRRFEIVNPLPAANLKEPIPDSTVVVLDETLTKISWEPVKNADYYDVIISIEGVKNPIFQYPLFGDTKLELSLSEYENVTWRVSIRAGASEHDNSTRLLGYIGDSIFRVRTLKPVTLISPANGSRYPGLDALRNGINVQWSSEEEITSSVLYITRDAEGKNVLIRKNNPEISDNLPKIKSGVYYFNIKAMTRIGYEITARAPYKFVVDPIPMLPKANLKQPELNGVIGFDYLKSNKSIVFAWDKVPGANLYDFKLVQKSNGKLLVNEKALKEPGYKFVKLIELGRGEYRWLVEALSVDKDGYLEQNGEISSGDFKIDVPEISKPIKKGAKEFYGR